MQGGVSVSGYADSPWCAPGSLERGLGRLTKLGKVGNPEIGKLAFAEGSNLGDTLRFFKVHSVTAVCKTVIFDL